MEHAFSRIVGIFTAVLMFFLIPLLINLQRQESMVQLSIMQDTVQFVDSVRNMGALTHSMYQEYQNQLRRAKAGLEIHMVHIVNSIHIGDHGIERIQKVRTEEEIQTVLDNEREYLFQKGDYFRVEVRRIESDLMERFQMFFYPEMPRTTTYVYYGGSIRYEI